MGSSVKHRARTPFLKAAPYAGSHHPTNTIGRAPLEPARAEGGAMIYQTMTLRSETYRDELADVAADSHDETGPQPTVQEIEAVLADLGAPDRGETGDV